MGVALSMAPTSAVKLKPNSVAFMPEAAPMQMITFDFPFGRGKINGIKWGVKGDDFWKENIQDDIKKTGRRALFVKHSETVPRTLYYDFVNGKAQGDNKLTPVEATVRENREGKYKIGHNNPFCPSPTQPSQGCSLNPTELLIEGPLIFLQGKYYEYEQYDDVPDQSTLTTSMTWKYRAHKPKYTTTGDEKTMSIIFEVTEKTELDTAMLLYSGDVGNSDAGQTRGVWPFFRITNLKKHLVRGSSVTNTGWKPDDLVDLYIPVSDGLNDEDHLDKKDADHIQGRKLQDYSFNNIVQRHIVQQHENNELMTNNPLFVQHGGMFAHTLMTKISGTWAVKGCGNEKKDCGDKKFEEFEKVNREFEKVIREGKSVSLNTLMANDEMTRQYICACGGADRVQAEWSNERQAIDQRSEFENALVAAIQQACAPAAPPAPPHQARSPPAARAHANLTRSRSTAN